MKLPILTPKELTSLEKLKGDRELFETLSSDLESGINFFEAAIDDENWSREHRLFLDQYIKWLTGLYYADELDSAISHKFYQVCVKNPLKVAPFLIKDLTVNVANQSFKANSIVAGHSSSFIRDQIRKASENGTLEVRLPDHHIRLAEYLFNSNRDMTGLDFDKLIEIAVSAKQLGLNETSAEAEILAARFLSMDNVFETIKMSHRLALNDLQKLSVNFFNRQNKGFFFTLMERDLIVIFRDLKILTTLEQYKSLGSIPSGIGFRGDLGKDPEIGAFIRLNPKIKILDLSETTAPIPFENIPEKLHALILNRAEWLNQDELENLAKRFPHIHKLELEDINYLSIGAYAAISLFKEVQEINLKGMRLNDDELQLILSEMTDLKILPLNGLKKLSTRGIEKALSSLDLTHIDLSNTNADDALVTFLISRMRKLEELNVQSSLVTKPFIENIRKKTQTKIIA